MERDGKVIGKLVLLSFYLLRRKKSEKETKERSQILREKNWRWPSLQADLIGMERDGKVIGKLDLFSSFDRDRKVILDLLFSYLDFWISDRKSKLIENGFVNCI